MHFFLSFDGGENSNLNFIFYCAIKINIFSWFYESFIEMNIFFGLPFQFFSFACLHRGTQTFWFLSPRSPKDDFKLDLMTFSSIFFPSCCYKIEFRFVNSFLSFFFRLFSQKLSEREKFSSKKFFIVSYQHFIFCRRL